jgi:hypothetical protein
VFLLSKISWPYTCGFISGLFGSIGLYVYFYFNITLFWLSYLCNTVWNKKTLVPQICTCFSKLFCPFRFFYDSIWTLALFSHFSDKFPWNHDRECIISEGHLGTMSVLILFIILIHENGCLFILLCPVFLAMFYRFKCTDLSLFC